MEYSLMGIFNDSQYTQIFLSLSKWLTLFKDDNSIEYITALIEYLDTLLLLNLPVDMKV